jgi:type I restriction enzyme S subunit
MASDWKKLSVREAGVALIDCVHKTPAAAGAGHPYVAIPQMVNGRLDLAAARKISTTDLIEWTKKAKPQTHDIVLSRRCNPGETAYVAAGENFALGQNLVLLRADGKKIYPPFLRWITRGPEWWEQIGTNLNVGAVFDSLKCADVPNFTLTIPPLSEQEEIVAVLGSLDDKIEQNRRTGRKLEELARAVFKAWFVDFEPVKAKAAGATAFPGMPPETFATLPKTRKDSPLGPVPEGWEVGTMGDVGEQRREQIAPEQIDGDTPYIGLEHMPRRDITLSDWGTAASVSSSKFSFCRGDILFGKLRPYFHKVGPAPLDGVCSTDIVVLYPTRREFAAWLLMLVSSDEFVAHTDRSSAGTKMPRTNWKDMAAFATTVPTSRVALTFQNQVGPMLDMIAASIHESRRLATLRDYLLPRLLSGRVRVREAVNA